MPSDESNFVDVESRIGFVSTPVNANPICLPASSTAPVSSLVELTCLRPMTGRYVSLQQLGSSVQMRLSEIEIVNAGTLWDARKIFDLWACETNEKGHFTIKLQSKKNTINL